MEGDPTASAIILVRRHFNPLPPHGGRRLHKRTVRGILSISIHSLRMEGDFLSSDTLLHHLRFQSTPSAWRETHFPKIIHANITDFNPLPPHGGRPDTQGQYRPSTQISIHSLRMEGDVADRKCHTLHPIISIHSLRMEGDTTQEDAEKAESNFNPLPPHGGRLA